MSVFAGLTTGIDVAHWVGLILLAKFLPFLQLPWYGRPLLPGRLPISAAWCYVGFVPTLAFGRSSRKGAPPGRTAGERERVRAELVGSSHRCLQRVRTNL